MPKRLPADQVETVIFNGIRFRRYPFSAHLNHQRYFTPGSSDIRRGVEALHREIWKHHHGAIPAGHDIHHLDDDPLNNDIANLAAVLPDVHKAEHEREGKWSGSRRVRKNLDEIRPLASAWHGSDEGRAWHSEHARTAYEAREPREYVCAQCGDGFKSKHFSSQRQDGKRFCAEKCAAKFKRAEGRGKAAKSCLVCNTEFQGSARTKTCSRKCAANHRWATTGRRLQP